MTVVDQSLVPLTLHVGRTSARDLDLTALLSRICTALPDATGAAGAVVLVMEPSDREPTLVASGAEAGRIGEVQRHGGAGPLPAVTRSGRPLRTPDLTRVGPPALAAAAAETGLTSSLVLPLIAGDERYGALQLLGTAARPVDPSQADAVRALLAALVARLVDVRALRQAAGPAEPRMPVPKPVPGPKPVPMPAPAPVPTLRPMPVPVPVQRAAPPPPLTQVDPGDVATMVIPAAVPAAVADAEATHVVAVPAQRRAAGARHRRADEPDDTPRGPNGEPARRPDPALVNRRHAAPADAPESRSGLRRRRR
ncbi:hypothetical protein GCM10009609_18060 [Pseudonocardia aurantiaca]|uniref:GAF domain-containing protein n=1 Tax=Pseudonocardia aurantiaca TaxID=75290 RepID=A0ABW4FUS0_9PSEU